MNGSLIPVFHVVRFRLVNIWGSLFILLDWKLLIGVFYLLWNNCLKTAKHLRFQIEFSNLVKFSREITPFLSFYIDAAILLKLEILFMSLYILFSSHLLFTSESVKKVENPKIINQKFSIRWKTQSPFLSDCILTFQHFVSDTSKWFLLLCIKLRPLSAYHWKAKIQSSI